MPAENITVYAKWDFNSYTLRFDTMEGSFLPALTLEYDAPIPTLPTPTKEGYNFLGWYSDEDAATSFNLTTMPAYDLNIYAGWKIQQFTITYDTGVTTSLFTVDFNAALSEPSEPVREGYTFNGWYLDEALTNAYSFPETMPAENITVYAKWLVNNYYISFEVNGGEFLSEINLSFNEPISLSVDPIKVGYTFVGWFENPELSQPFSLETMPDRELTLYAGWQVNSYTVTFKLDGNLISSLTTIPYGENILDFPVLEKEGYQFLGWKDEAGNLIDENWIMPANSVEFFASWLGLSSQMIFVYGNETLSRIFTSGEIVGGLPALPVKEGYRFVGWSTTPHDIVGLIDETDLVANGQTMIVYPIWEKLETPTSTSTPASSDPFMKSTGSGHQPLTISIWIMGMTTLGTLIGFLFYGLKGKTYANH